LKQSTGKPRTKCNDQVKPDIGKQRPTGSNTTRKLCGTTKQTGKNVGFEVLMAMSTQMAVSWVAVPCSLTEVYQRFTGPLKW
jgi:hypothetical protein